MFSLLTRIFRGPPIVKRTGTEAGEAACVEASAEYYKKIGNKFFVHHDMDQALAHYWKALAVDPDYRDAQWNISMASLFVGDYATGFRYFEQRFRAGDKAHAAHLQGVLTMMAGKRCWNGEPLRGERLLVWTEQGFGDSLMFMRFLSGLRGKGDCRLMVACEPELVRVMTSLAGVDAVVSKDALLPSDSFDLHCSLLSLPHRLGTTLDTLPCAVPYVFPPPGLIQGWADRLATLRGLKVGLVWAGGQQLAQDALRSMALARLELLRDLAGVTLVSLQKGEPARQLGELGWAVADWTAECHDFMATAALVAGLDLVISVDTAVAHLAGALGKPVWLLNRYDSEWRWMLDREDSPWYPTMRIFRQPKLHDWDSVVTEVARELRSLVRP